MLPWIKKLFEDSGGNPSWMRLFGCMAAMLILCTWAFCVFKEGRWIPLDGWASGIIGVIFGGKTLQKAFEPSGGDDAA